MAELSSQYAEPPASGADACTLAPGHAVTMTIDCDDASAAADVATCSCGAVFRVPRHSPSKDRRERPYGAGKSAGGKSAGGLAGALAREEEMAALLAAHRAEVAVRAAQWTRVRAALRCEFGAGKFDAFLSHLELIGVDAVTVRLSASTRFLRHWVDAHYRDGILDAWRGEDAAIARVVTATRAIGRQFKPPVTGGPASPAKGPAVAAPASVTPERVPKLPAIARRLDPAMRLDNYVVYGGNHLAHAAITHAIAESGAHDFNPVYVHGACGLGKTHLLQGAVAAVAAPDPRRAFYLSPESLAADVAMIRQLAVMPRLIAVDDVHLAGKAAPGVLRSVIDKLTAAGCQIVLAASVPTADLGYPEDMRARLGFAVPVHGPDTDARARIVEARLADIGDRAFADGVGADVVAAIAATVRGDGRALMKVLGLLHLGFTCEGVRPSAERVRELAAQEDKDNRPAPRIGEIQQAVARHFNVALIDLLSERRTLNVVRPRQFAMYLAKTLTLRSLPEIGRRFGGRDHTTVLHAVRKIEALIETDLKLAGDIAAVKAELAAR